VVKRTQGTVKHQKKEFKVSKGAPHVIVHLVTEHEADKAKAHEITKRVEEAVTDFGLRGVRCVAIARTDTLDGPWYMLGLITFLDPPRPDTKQVCIVVVITSRFSMSSYRYDDCRPYSMPIGTEWRSR
jgi:H+-transporting ATPase